MVFIGEGLFSFSNLPFLPARRRLTPTMMRIASLPFFVFASLLVSRPVSGQDRSATFQSRVRPLIENHCVECHGPVVQKAKLRLDTLTPDLGDERTGATWATVHDKLMAGEMPP